MTLTGTVFNLAGDAVKSELTQYAWRKDQTGAGRDKGHAQQNQTAITAMTQQFLASEVSNLQTKVHYCV
jgi:hypothetical protein